MKRRGRFFQNRTDVWKEVAGLKVGLNSHYRDAIRTPYGHHMIDDLDIDLAQLSQRLEKYRLDADRAREIHESPSSVKGQKLVIDFDHRELIYFPDRKAFPTLVYPFSAFECVGLSPEPCLVEKTMKGFWYDPKMKIGDFPIEPSELANRMVWAK